jgi:RimJ/RimL family protein N-acetyltransferase
VLEIVTERLTLRPFQADDLPDFVAYRSDPEVARYQLPGRWRKASRV